MDNLTHSLIGAMIGQTGLKKLSGLGMPTLIIAANIPDIDAACFFWLEGQEHLGFRRGITHGPLAMLLLPLLLTAVMIGFDRWQTQRGKRPETRLPVRPLQLFLLALIGTLSHPAFDWLNNYGVRLLEPFSSQWFYGDSIFIIDLWMWIILIGGWVWSWRAENGGGNWMRRGTIVVTLIAAYVFTNGVITGQAESQALAQLRSRVPAGATMPDPLVVASPVPLAFWKREILWRDEFAYGSGSYAVARGVKLDDEQRPHNAADPRLAIVAAVNPDARAFLFWSRMPVARFEGDELVLTDQRFSDPMVGDRFTVSAKVEP